MLGTNEIKSNKDAYRMGHCDGYIGRRYEEPWDNPNAYRRGYIDGTKDFHDCKSPHCKCRVSSE